MKSVSVSVRSVSAPAKPASPQWVNHPAYTSPPIAGTSGNAARALAMAPAVPPDSAMAPPSTVVLFASTWPSPSSV